MMSTHEFILHFQQKGRLRKPNLMLLFPNAGRDPRSKAPQYTEYSQQLLLSSNAAPFVSSQAPVRLDELH